MPVPTLISELSQTPGSNFPLGSESPSVVDDYFRTYAAFIAQHRDGKGYTAEATLASAATADIGAQNSFFVQITGTTTITSFGTNYNGPRYVRFAGALTLTHNATTLILPGAANITTAAGDRAILTPIGNPGTGWQVLAYQRATGDLLINNTTSQFGYGPGSGGTVTQATSKSTGVTLNRASGQITMNNAALAAGARVSFTLTNSAATINDTVIVNYSSGSANPDDYLLRARVANGVVVITVINQGAAPLSDAVVLNFALIKGAVS